MLSKRHIFHGRRPRSLVVGLLLSVSAFALFELSPATAQTSLVPDRSLPDGSAEFIQVQQGRVSLQQAIAIATERVNGRVVRADTVMRNGRLIHEVLIIRDDGLVRTVHVDPETGRIL